MSSKDVEKELESAHQELKSKEQALLEAKEAFMAEVKSLLPARVESAVSQLLGENAKRIQEMPADALKDMKSALETAKPKAVQRGVELLQTSANWLWTPGRPSARTSRDPLDTHYGVTEDGEIWQAFQNYGSDIIATFKKFGMEVEEHSIPSYPRSPFRWHLPRNYPPDKIEKLQEINDKVGQAHNAYCEITSKVRSLEDTLTRVKARERYEAA